MPEDETPKPAQTIINEGLNLSRNSPPRFGPGDNLTAARNGPPPNTVEKGLNLAPATAAPLSTAPAQPIASNQPMTPPAPPPKK